MMGIDMADTASWVTVAHYPDNTFKIIDKGTTGHEQPELSKCELCGRTPSRSTHWIEGKSFYSYGCGDAGLTHAHYHALQCDTDTGAMVQWNILQDDIRKSFGEGIRKKYEAEAQSLRGQIRFLKSNRRPRLPEGLTITLLRRMADAPLRPGIFLRLKDVGKLAEYILSFNPIDHDEN
jgi:hypothetical protein